MRLFHRRPLVFFVTVYLLSLILSVRVPAYGKFILMLLAGIGSVTLLVFLLLRRKTFKRLLIASVAILLAFFFSFLGFDLHLDSLTDYYGTEVTVKAQVDEINGTYADCTLLSINGKTHRAKIKCEFTSMEKLQENDVFSATMTLVPFSEDSTYAKADGFSCRGVEIENTALLERRGPSFLSVFSNLKTYLSGRIESSVPGEGGRLFSALLLGKRDGLSTSTEFAFQRLGITHILALSGLHLSILTGALYFLLRKLFVPRSIRISCAVALVLFYMAITNFSPSILRAGFMLFFTAASFFVGRKSDSFTSLFAAVFFICFCTPWSIYDVGLWLSMFGTVGVLLALFYFPKKKEKRRFVSRLFSTVSTPLLISLFASLLTLPLIALFFGRTSLIAPLANLFFSPLLTVCIYLSFFAAFIPFPHFLSAAVGKYCDFILSLISKLSDVSGISVSLAHPFLMILILLLSGALIWLLSTRIRSPRAPIAVFLSFLLLFSGFLIGDSLYRRSALSATVLSTTSGEFLLLENQGETVLVDASSGGAASANALFELTKEKRVQEIDYYTVTHYTTRTLSTLKNIVGAVKVYTLLLPIPINEAERGYLEEIEEIAKEHRIQTVVFESSIALESGVAELNCRSEEYPYGIFSFSDGTTRFSYARFSQLKAEKKLAAQVVAASDYIVVGNITDLQFFVVYPSTDAHFIFCVRDGASFTYGAARDETEFTALKPNQKVSFRIKR